MEENETKDIIEKIEEESEKVMTNVMDEGIHNDNIDFLGKVVDIHKDIANEKYWKEKEDYYMRYRGNYGNYGDYTDDSYGRRQRDSRGRYMDGGSYGRRGVPGSGRGRYRGHDMIDDVYDNYSRYSEGQEEYNRGNYGAKEDTIKSLEYMMESVVCFIEMLQEDANNQEEMDVIRKYTSKISEM